MQDLTDDFRKLKEPLKRLDEMKRPPIHSIKTLSA
jgi:hypothetical protein